MKTCTKCREEKSLSGFQKNRALSDGLQKICKACMKKYNDAHYRANKESKIQKSKDWYSENSERKSETQSIWRKTNADRDKESSIVRTATRRARKRSVGGTYNASNIHDLYRLQRGRCASCCIDLIQSGPGKFHVDHIMPIARGGSNWPNNLQLLCPPCNLSKHAKDPFVWAVQNGRLL